MSLNKRKSLLDVVTEKAAQITAKCREERQKSRSESGESSEEVSVG